MSLSVLICGPGEVARVIARPSEAGEARGARVGREQPSHKARRVYTSGGVQQRNNTFGRGLLHLDTGRGIQGCSTLRPPLASSYTHFS